MAFPASNSVTVWPRSAAVTAADNPAGPAPTTATCFTRRVGPSTSVVSWPARGLSRQDTVLCTNAWSRQAWLHAMQVLISSAASALALFTQSGSDSSGRAIEINWTWPSARICSADCGMLIRLDATTGIPTYSATALLMSTNALLGTDVTMVGTRASCQPMPELMMVAPAASTSVASAMISSQLWPPST